MRAPASGAFVSGATKPNASNTGAGVVRAYPTRVINGDVTLTGNESLVDTIVHGRVSVKGTNNLVENCVITGSTTSDYSGDIWLVNTSAAKNAIIRFNTIRSARTSNHVSGIGLRNLTAERNNISRVIDAFDIDPASSGGDVNTVIRDNYVHHLMFYAPDPKHNATPTPSSYSGPWARTAWSHDDGIQIMGGSGLRVTGNTIVANWASDIGTAPLPTIVKELSALMINSNHGQVTNLVLRDNWLDGGEYNVNGGGASGSGDFTGNRFGRRITGGWDSSFTLVFDSAFHATTSGNVYEDNGDPVRVRSNW